MLAINKHSAKLKICSTEMPNAPYANRWGKAKKISYSIEKYGK